MAGVGSRNKPLNADIRKLGTCAVSAGLSTSLYDISGLFHHRIRNFPGVAVIVLKKPQPVNAFVRGRYVGDF